MREDWVEDCVREVLDTEEDWGDSLAGLFFRCGWLTRGVRGLEGLAGSLARRTGSLEGFLEVV